MSYFATSVTGFGTFIRERPPVRSRAVAGDVAEFTASVALHGLSLAIACIVIRATAFVAGRSARNTGISTTETTKTATRAAAAADLARTCGSRIWAVACNMASLTAGVASTSSTTQTKSWAVGLNMTDSLAVVALLGLGSTWHWAAVTLMSRLLAIVAKALGRGADLGIVAHIATLVACAATKRRHCDRLPNISS